METSAVSSSSNSVNEDILVEIKQENSDLDCPGRPDKVIQFTLALQRKEKDVTPLSELESERTKAVELVDLTLSDEEPSEEYLPREISTSNGTEEEESSAQTVPTEKPKNTDVMSSSLVNSTVDEEETAYKTAMNSLEVYMDIGEPVPTNKSTVEEDTGDLSIEYGDANGFESPINNHSIPREEVEQFFGHFWKSRQRSPGKRTPTKGGFASSPTPYYTEEEKQIAIRGNPKFDYRTRVHATTGQELYALFKCVKCPTGFPRMYHLLMHMKGHGGNGSHLCQLCDYGTANSALLAVHMERHRLQNDPGSFTNMPERRSDPKANKRNQAPPSASLGSKKSRMVTRRQSESRDRETNASSEINEESASTPVSTALLKESRRLVEEPVEEGNKVKNPERLNGSGRRYGKVYGKMNKQISLECPECPYVGKNYDIFMAHRRGHTVNRAYRCSQCSYSAATSYYLERHSMIHGMASKVQPSQSAVAQDGVGEGLGENEVASDQFIKQRAGRVGTSSLIASLQCSKCPSRFSGATNRNIHERQHGKPGTRFRCQICDYGSNREDYIRNHLQAHGLNSSFEMLGRPDNISAEEYKRIIEGNPKISYMTVSIHGNPVPLETSLKCWHCPFATTKYVSYISHQNCHGANSKYQCPACNYTAKTYRGMRNHELAHKIEHSVTSSQSAPATEPVALPSTLASTFSPPLQASSTAESGYGNGNVVADSFFLSSIKIMNIKPMNRNSPTIADAFQNGILKLKGDTDEGKSSFILAVMLGLGYDLFLESNEPSSPISICGLELNNIISYGKNFATIDLIISLSSFPELQQEYGTLVKFHRRLQRDQTDLSNMIVISSADPNFKGFAKKTPKILGLKELEAIFLKLKLTPNRLRLMLLDGENVKYMMNNPQIWYGFLEDAVNESGVDVNRKIQETEFLLDRLSGSEKWKQMRIEYLKTQLEAFAPLDSEEIQRIKESDLEEYSKCTEETKLLEKERHALLKKLKGYQNELRDGMDEYMMRMRVTFNRFLRELGYCGEIAVCSEKKELAICLRKLESKETPPTNFEEVLIVWKSMSNGKRHLAVIALYLAFWEITNYLQVFIADAFSCTETDFKVPASGLPVLWDLVNKKCLERKQCIISLPPDF